MRELSKQWDTLSDVEKSNISFNLAGTRQINVIQNLLRNWSEYEDLVNKANDSTGVTIENQGIYAESLSGKIGELSAIWSNISNDTVSPSFLKGLAEAGIGISSLIEKIGLLKSGHCRICKELCLTLKQGYIIKPLLQFYNWANRDKENDKMVH